MAKTSKIVRNKRMEDKAQRDLSAGKKPVHAIRIRNRCQKCGRPRGYMRAFGVCRACLRELASRGEVSGLKKSSW